jgi:sugar phosphate isomerase/epimerase
MEIGLSTWVYESVPIEAAVQAIHDHINTVTQIELWGDTPTHLNPTAGSRLYVDRLQQLLRTAAITPHSCHAPFTNLDLSDSRRCKQAVHALLKTITFCHQLNCSALTLHISASPGVKTRAALKQAKECTIDSLGTIISLARERHVDILLENLVPRAQHLRLGAEIEDLIDIVEALNGQGVGICIDTGHSVLNRHDPSEDIRKAGRWLRSLHINDNNGLEDLHMVPGKGVIRWGQVYHALHDIHYDGVFMLEIEGRSPIETTIQAAVNYATDLIQ